MFNKIETHTFYLWLNNLILFLIKKTRFYSILIQYQFTGSKSILSGNLI